MSQGTNHNIENFGKPIAAAALRRLPEKKPNRKI
jgi:hypothetical protein